MLELPTFISLFLLGWATLSTINCIAQQYIKAVFKRYIHTLSATLDILGCLCSATLDLDQKKLPQMV